MTDFDELIGRALLDPPAAGRSPEWFRTHGAARQRRRRAVVITSTAVVIAGAVAAIAFVSGGTGDDSISVVDAGVSTSALQTIAPSTVAPSTAAPSTVVPSTVAPSVTAAVSLMPDVRGLPLTDATRRLDGLHLAWEVVESPSDDVPAGLVYASEPAPGTPVGIDRPVVLSVSSGPSVARSTSPPIVCAPSPGLPADAVPLNTIPTQIPITDATSPVAVTGARIGDRVTDLAADWTRPDGSIDLSRVPVWAPVAADGVVVGYEYNPNGRATDGLSPEQINPDCHPETAIYDESGFLIGNFVDGLPVVTG